MGTQLRQCGSEHLNHPNRKPEPSDEDVEALIAQYPEGVPLAVIGATMGLTRERVYQILKDAIAKCLRKAKAKGLEPGDFPSRESIWDQIARG